MRTRWVTNLIGLFMVSSNLFAQGRELKPDETMISVIYSVCLTPPDPFRIAFGEEAQARIPECKRWSTPERMSKDIRPREYVGQSSGTWPPVNAFLKDLIQTVYRFRLRPT